MPVDVAQPQVYRNSFWRGVALVWVPVLGVTTWDIARRGFPASGWPALAVMAAVTVVVYAVGWRPAVLAGPESVVVRNPLRTSTIPWSSVTGIDVTDALRVHTDRGVVRAWAVDRGGAASNMLRGASSKRLTATRGIERDAMEALARRSPADYAVATLLDMWRARRDGTRGAVRTVWAWPVVAAFAIAVVAAVVLLAI